MAKLSVSTSLQKDTSYFSTYNSPYARDESIYINPFYERFIADPNFGGLTTTFVQTGGWDTPYPEYRYLSTRTLVQGGGGNDDYVVGSYGSISRAGTYTVNWSVVAINIATGGAGYNTLTWNYSGAYYVDSNGASNMVVYRKGNDLKLLFNPVGALDKTTYNASSYGTLTIQSWFDTSQDYKIEKFTFKSASNQIFVRSASEMEALVAGKTITDASISDFLSTTAKSLVTPLRVSAIDLDSVSSSISGASTNGLAIAAKAILADRSVSGELKFWSVAVDGVNTKAVQILFKDTNSGIDVTELQARYTSGDKTDGSYNFNTQGTNETLATSESSAGYGAAKVSFSGVVQTSKPSVLVGSSYSEVFISEFLTKATKNIVTSLHVSQIDDYSLTGSISGGSVGIIGAHTIVGKAMLVDRSVSGELKYWQIGIETPQTKAVQILLKDTDTGISVTALQAKFIRGHSGSYDLDFNSQGISEYVAEGFNLGGYGVNEFGFSGHGTGNDTYTVTNRSDVIYEASNAGIDTVQTSVTYTLGSNIENLNLTGTASINGSGNELNNIIIGNAAGNVLDGGAGNNTIYGGFGDDVIMSGAGYSNFYDGGDGSDTVDYSNSAYRAAVILSPDSGWDITSSGGGAYTNFVNSYVTDWNRKDTFASIENVTGSKYADEITGSTTANRINGGAGDDVINGMGGDDILDGGIGNNTIYGGLGADNIIGGAGYANFYDGGDGSDTVDYSNNAASVAAQLFADSSWGLYQAGGGAYTNFQNAVDWERKDNFVSIENLIGSKYADTLVGNSDANFIEGGDGNDTICGMNGNDNLVGGLGNDTLTGGLGIDNFVFNVALISTNVDTVIDFSVTQSDRIVLDHNIFAKLNIAQDLTNFFALGVAQTATNYLLYNKETGVISYDPDGSGAGVAEIFAFLSNKPTDISSLSFKVI
jgi:Ca2+-binding RTX toxin-like protein